LGNPQKGTIEHEPQAKDYLAGQGPRKESTAVGKEPHRTQAVESPAGQRFARGFKRSGPAATPGNSGVVQVECTARGYPSCESKCAFLQSFGSKTESKEVTVQAKRLGSSTD